MIKHIMHSFKIRDLYAVNVTLFQLCASNRHAQQTRALPENTLEWFNIAPEETLFGMV